MNSPLTFPQRYEALRRLGTGGGGEVWSVKDRYTQERLALKVLAEDASEHEMAALVREAVALSGLEGLGVPRVLRFGRLPGSGRPYLVRELVDGNSLDDLLGSKAPTGRILAALAHAAEQLTLVHRAGFFHGDVKPANVIVAETGEATLVDLGLSAPWLDAGVPAPGLTPKYAAPELLGGKALTVRAEVYALGVALRETVERGEESLKAQTISNLLKVAQRATAVEPEERYPSADEFASALNNAAGVERRREDADVALMWPVLGIDAMSGRLLQRVIAMQPGAVLNVLGESGSGRTVLLRRLAWSLGVEGRPLIWVDEYMGAHAQAIEAELSSHSRIKGLNILVDDGASLGAAALRAVREARARGASIVVVGEVELGCEASSFEVPPLAEAAASELLKRAIPSLTPRLIKRLSDAAHGRPGELKRLVGLLSAKAIVSEEDIDALLTRASGDSVLSAHHDPLARAISLLDRGRFKDVAEWLERVEGGDPLVVAVAEARLRVGLADVRAALTALEAVRGEAERRSEEQAAKAWKVWLARAQIGLSEYSSALELLTTVHDEPGSVGAEALAFEGLALLHIDDQEASRRVLERAVEVARQAGDPRVQALALTCLALLQQRADHLDEAKETYGQALACAHTAGDASTLGTVQLNLAGLLRVRGDIAAAIEYFEAALDMGRRSGRRATVRQSLLDLANTDLYLGRLARARSSIEALKLQLDTLPAMALAQLHGLEGELAARSGDSSSAVKKMILGAEAYEKIGSAVQGAESRLEAVLIASAGPEPDIAELSEQVAKSKVTLDDASAHRALVLLATARVAYAAGDEDAARSALNLGLEAAQVARQRDWIWRILAFRAEIEKESGQVLMARRDRIEAVTILEEIGARLPRDLREVFWNDSRRRDLRREVELVLSTAQTQYAPVPQDPASINQSPISAFTSTPLEQRLARILEVNRELLGELDLGKLSSKITEYAVELLKAERGFVILRDEAGELQVYSRSTRQGDSEHLEFSRSIAEQVMDSGEPIVSISARDDARMQGFSSVHQMLLESVACVPIRARHKEPIGALYVETRRRPGRGFERELPTLRAFADQVSLALETARLISENQRRADDLAAANVELRKAQTHLKDLLGERTEKLKRARRKLRDAQDTLYGHFGFQGMVGTGEQMRRCYSLIERVKDTDVPVLITGESGTGKEIAARAIHRASVRAKEPFLGINCGAIPEHLLESELFGHVRGAFTGADKERKGLIREANGGSVLLDEIGEMPHKMQAGLLRVLQERKVRPVGGTREESVSCRFIFATHRNLEQMVREGKFREDLYYRIHVLELKLPPLRDRGEDIALLVDHFLGIFAARYKRDRGTVSRAALRRLTDFYWPGNVRQLEHVLLNAWILSEVGEIDADDLDLPDAGLGSRGPTQESPGDEDAPANDVASVRAPKARKETLSAHRRSEKERIIDALRACNWNRVKAAELSGIPRRTFYRRLREYDIQ